MKKSKTQAEREKMIEQYMNGIMTPQQEEEFFLELALDKDFQVDLRANRLIDQSIQAGQKAAGRDHTAMRSHLMVLAASSPAATLLSKSKAEQKGKGSPASQGIAWYIAGTFAIYALLLSIILFITISRVKEPPSSPEIELQTPVLSSPQQNELSEKNLLPPGKATENHQVLKETIPEHSHTTRSLTTPSSKETVQASRPIPKELPAENTTGHAPSQKSVDSVALQTKEKPSQITHPNTQVDTEQYKIRIQFDDKKK